MSIKIFHNPRCSKSRSTLEILSDNSADVDVVEYLKDTPDRDELKSILGMLGMSPRDLMRKHEAPYKENNLDSDSLSEDELIDYMIKYPILIERPIVVSNGKAVIGRPPENVKELF
jgi:arsenate reductase